MILPPIIPSNSVSDKDDLPPLGQVILVAVLAYICLFLLFIIIYAICTQPIPPTQ